MKLLTSKWRHLFLSNFLGVFNDNFLKNAIIFISVTWVLPEWMSQSQLISVVSACLVLPYLVFSPLGGRLAVRYSKVKVFRINKLLEIPVLIFSCLAFYKEWVLPAILSVLAMGVLSSLYSPSKYGLIRDIGGEEGVSSGSGGFEAMAFLGILLGTFAASVISDTENKHILNIAFLLIAIAGYIVTTRIKADELPPEDENPGKLSPVSFFRHSYRMAAKYPLVNASVLGSAVFWLIGSVLQMNLVIHSTRFYGESNTMTGISMGVAAVGIAFGTWLAGRISGNKVESGLVLLGLSGMSLSLLLVLVLPMSFDVFLGVVFLFALSGGMFQVPNLSLIQSSPLGRNLGVVFAYLNLLTFILILIGTALFSLTTSLTNQNSFAVFGVLLVISLLAIIYYLRKSEIYRKSFLRLFSLKK